MSEVLTVLANVSVLVFVISSMLAMGLSLTMTQIIKPLSNVSLVVKALVANFVLAPLLGYIIVAVIPMADPLKVGLILLATAAGAPFLPKLVQAGKGDIAFGVGLMVLLMVVTVIFVPLVLPLLLPGVSVNPLEIASSLVVLMLVPLAGGLFVRARYPEMAASMQPAFSQASSTALVLLTVLMLVLNFRTVLGAVGSGAIIAALLFIVGSFVVGYFLGGPAATTRPVMALGTAQRNVSAALVVAGANFTDPNILVMILVGALLMLIVLMLAAGEMGKRAAGAPEPTPQAASKA